MRQLSQMTSGHRCTTLAYDPHAALSRTHHVARAQKGPLTTTGSSLCKQRRYTAVFVPSPPHSYHYTV